MGTSLDDTVELTTRNLMFLKVLGSVAEDLANRAGNAKLSAADRAALRNQARHANETAANIMGRGAIDLFGGPPPDAATEIDGALAHVQVTLEHIQSVGAAIKFAAMLIGLGAAVLSGNWSNIAKGLAQVVKTAKT